MKLMMALFSITLSTAVFASPLQLSYLNDMYFENIHKSERKIEERENRDARNDAITNQHIGIQMLHEADKASID
jgi:hypothetical protein